VRPRGEARWLLEWRRRSTSRRCLRGKGLHLSIKRESVVGNAALARTSTNPDGSMGSGWAARSAFVLNAGCQGPSVDCSDRMSVAHSRQNIGAPWEAEHPFQGPPGKGLFKTAFGNSVKLPSVAREFPRDWQSVGSQGRRLAKP
jgi:hypothetical protein